MSPNRNKLQEKVLLFEIDLINMFYEKFVCSNGKPSDQDRKIPL